MSDRFMLYMHLFDLIALVSDATNAFIRLHSLLEDVAVDPCLSEDEREALDSWVSELLGW